MGKRPSHTLFYVLLGVAVVFGLYILGGFILDVRRDNSSATSYRLGHIDGL